MRHLYSCYKSLVLLLLLLASFTAKSQNRIENIRVTEPVERSDGQVVVKILYDLISDDPESTYNIEIFSSLDSYTFPLRWVNGEGVGPGVKPGTDLEVEWYPLRELSSLNEEVTFEVRGRLEVPVVTPTAGPSVTGLNFKRPVAGAKFRPGTTESLQWEGGAAEDNFKLELIRNSVKQSDIGTTINTGNFNWKIPQDTKGKGFQVKLTDAANPNRSVLSGRFKVGKTSFLVYAIPAAVVVGVASYFILTADPCKNDPNSYECLQPIGATPPSNPQ